MIAMTTSKSVQIEFIVVPITITTFVALSLMSDHHLLKTVFVWGYKYCFFVIIIINFKFEICLYDKVERCSNK